MASRRAAPLTLERIVTEAVAALYFVDQEWSDDDLFGLGLERILDTLVPAPR